MKEEYEYYIRRRYVAGMGCIVAYRTGAKYAGLIAWEDEGWIPRETRGTIGRSFLKNKNENGHGHWENISPEEVFLIML